MERGPAHRGGAGQGGALCRRFGAPPPPNSRLRKNAIDWLSRPPQDVPRVFRGRPVAIIGASPGRLGAAFSQTAWLQVFRALGMRPWFGASLYVGGASALFDAGGKLTDADTRKRLSAFVEGFAAYCAG
ncbi:MAG: NADPH-dependent FMN reductase [Pseudomonadota bacterium]